MGFVGHIHAINHVAGQRESGLAYIDDRANKRKLGAAVSAKTENPAQQQECFSFFRNFPTTIRKKPPKPKPWGCCGYF